MKRLETTDIKDIEKNNRTKLSDRVEKQFDVRKIKESSGEYPVLRSGKTEAVHNTVGISMQQQNRRDQTAFSPAESSALFTGEREQYYVSTSQVVPGRFPDHISNNWEMIYQSFVYNHRYVPRIDVPALMVDKKKILCNVPKASYFHPIEEKKSDTRPIYREHILVLRNGKGESTVNKKEREQNSNEKHVADYMQQDSHVEEDGQTSIEKSEHALLTDEIEPKLWQSEESGSDQNQVDIRLLELRRQLTEYPNGNPEKHYRSEGLMMDPLLPSVPHEEISGKKTAKLSIEKQEHVPVLSKTKPDLEKSGSMNPDSDQENIRSADIRLLELEREFRKHPDGNLKKHYQSQNFSRHSSEEIQKNTGTIEGIGAKNESDFVKSETDHIEVVEPRYESIYESIDDEFSAGSDIDIRRLELEHDLVESAIENQAEKKSLSMISQEEVLSNNKVEKYLDRIPQKIQKNDLSIFEEYYKSAIGAGYFQKEVDTPGMILGIPQVQKSSLHEESEDASFDHSEQEMQDSKEWEGIDEEDNSEENFQQKENSKKDDTEENSYFIKKENNGKIAQIAQNAEKISNVSRIINHEMDSLYDSEERKKSAAKDYITGKLKGKAKASAAAAAKKAGKKVAEKAVTLVASGIKAAVSFLAPFLPIIGIIIVVVGLIMGIAMGAAEYEQQQQQGSGQGGYFGKMYYWIEYETGKTDDSAFATVLGDGGRAFGIQFDYAYALQPFLNYCYGRNPIAYAPFLPYLNVPKANLFGNQQLATAWTTVFETNKEAFIQDQKDFAKANYYDGIERRAEQAGIKLKDRDEVCKGAVLSYSFQCGGGSAYQAVVELKTIEDDEEFLKQIYTVRTREFPQFQSRYTRELETALSLLHGQGDFVPPVDMSKCVVTSEFGEYRSPSDPSHKGTDFGSIGAVAVPTYAIGDGTVLIAGYSSSAGNWVVIDHGNGLVAKYMHHESIRVSVGQQVKKGQQIGNMGTTGDSTGVHLHLQLELNGVPVNPRDYITF